MDECCSNEIEIKSKNLKQDCVVCGQKSLTVPLKTILHHVKRAWKIKFSDQPFFYCHNPTCEVVYFAKDTSVINKSELRTLIGIKEQSGDTAICFCFGVSKKEAATDKEVKEFVIKQTKESMCSCETANPSGRCCLKDFPKEY